MKIDLSTETSNETFLSWLVCNLVGDRFKEAFPIDELITKAEVKLVINGLEFDPKECFERLYAEFERIANERGYEIAKRALGDAVTLRLEGLWPDYVDD